MTRPRKRQANLTRKTSRNAEDRRQQAAKRAEEYAKLTVSQKIALLDSKLGANVGAKKQRKRLLAKLES